MSTGNSNNALLAGQVGKCLRTVNDWNAAFLGQQILRVGWPECTGHDHGVWITKVAGIVADVDCGAELTKCGNV